MTSFLNSKIHDISDASLEPTGETASSIALFRAAMHSIAEGETARPVPAEWLMPARRRQRRAQRTMVLAWACAAALCFAIVPHEIHPHDVAHNGVNKVSPQPVQTEESYTALLEQVDNEIAEPVPSSLAPLTELDSWNSTVSNTSTEKKNVTQ
jgi:hypothetical protein